MKKVIIATLAVTAVLGSAGCASAHHVDTSSSPPAAAKAQQQSATPGPFGSTLRYWQTAATETDYTAIPTRPGEYDIIAVRNQGDGGSFGRFVALTSSGAKLEEAGESGDVQPGQFDETQVPVVGQQLKGWIKFDVPPGQTITKLYMFDGPIPGIVWS